ncbi:MAG: PAS domain S-box protein [Magnetococcus sp. THC-1_WYH]
MVSFVRGQSLSGKLLRILLSLTVVAVLALFLVLELDFYRGERMRLVESLSRLVDVQGAAIVDAVWEFDLERIRLLLAEQSRLPFFHAAEVIGKEGEILASAGDPGEPPRSPDFRLEYPLRHQSASGPVIIGKLVVTVHDDGIRAIMLQHLKVNGTILLTLLAALSAGTLVGVRIVIGRPLEEFRCAIERPMEMQIETPLQWDRTDELGKVLNAYNIMLAARNQAEIATRQREAELREAARVAQEANAESERFNRLAIGRELRIIELKGRINDMAQALGQPLPFDTLHADDVSLADTPSTEDSRGKLRQGKLAALSLAEDIELARKELSVYKDQLEEMVAERTQALRISEERTRLLLTSVGEGVFGVDIHGIVSFANPQCVALLGYSEDELLGSSAHALFHHARPDGSDYPAHECWMTKSITEGLSCRIDDEVLWTKDGAAFPVEYHSTPIWRDGQRVGAVISFNDISERLKVQSERDKAMELISGSIRYASRIQRSVLPDNGVMERTFADYFILWEPRDVVGGDMYWCCPWGDGVLVALGDCTGHGVPGAFMTLIANGALEQSFLETRPGDQAALIQRMHQLMQSSLGQDKEETWKAQGDVSDDGIELGVCFINARRKTMTFSGARFSLFVAEVGIVREIKGDKSGIGYRGIDRDLDFTNHEIAFGPEKRFYMTSDGILDQVGGEKGLGFGKRRFTRLLADLWALPMAQQKQRIKQALTDHQGSYGRRDDVSVIGFQGFEGSLF